MKFYTEEAAQSLANEKRKPVCAWTPCLDSAGEVPVQGLGEHKFVVEPRGSIKEYEASPKGKYAQRRVFRPQ